MPYMLFLFIKQAIITAAAESAHPAKEKIKLRPKPPHKSAVKTTLKKPMVI